MIGAVQVTNSDLFPVNRDSTDRTITKHEPRVESVGGLTPGQVEDGTHQMHEESAVADESDALFGLTVPITMARE